MVVASAAKSRQILIDGQTGDVEVARQKGFQRHRGRDFSSPDQAAGKLENALMDGLEEMLRLEKVGDAIESLVIDEDRAQQCLLGLDIVRRHAERGFRRRLLACSRIECCHGPDQGISLWPIWGNSTSRTTRQTVHYRTNSRCAYHERTVDSRAAARWEMLIAPFPVTHRISTRSADRSSSLLTFGFSRRPRSARYSPARRSGSA